MLPINIRAHFHVELNMTVLTGEGVTNDGPTPAGLLMIASTHDGPHSDESLALYVVGRQPADGNEYLMMVQPGDDECSLVGMGPCGGSISIDPQVVVNSAGEDDDPSSAEDSS